MDGTDLRRLIRLVLALLVAVTSHAASFEKTFVEGLNRVARDIHAAARATGAGEKDAAVAALARESASVDSYKKLVFSIESAAEIDKAIEQLRLYGYRVTSKAEKQAFEQGMHILETRVKYPVAQQNRSAAGC